MIRVCPGVKGVMTYIRNWEEGRSLTKRVSERKNIKTISIKDM